MGILTSAKACPKCKCIDRYRIQRSLWMRLIPGSRHYECDSCQHLYVYFPLGLILLLGFILFALGEGFVLYVLIADDIGTRYRGFGFHGKIGAVLGASLA